MVAQAYDFEKIKGAILSFGIGKMMAGQAILGPKGKRQLIIRKLQDADQRTAGVIIDHGRDMSLDPGQEVLHKTLTIA